MFVIASTTPVPPPNKTPVPTIKHPKRKIKSKNIDSINKIRQAVTDLAKAEIKYIQSFLPAGLLDDDED